MINPAYPATLIRETDGRGFPEALTGGDDLVETLQRAALPIPEFAHRIGVPTKTLTRMLDPKHPNNSKSPTK